MNTHKEFKLSSWAISNKTTVFVITAIIFLAGILSYKGMPRENFPEIVMPQIFVTTVYPGNSALDIEKLITKPLEKEINAITGVDKITSNSVQGFSTIKVEFNFDTTPSEALQKVKDKIDVAMADSDFPTDLPSEPNVVEMNFSEMMPIMNLNLSGDFSMDQLKEYAEYLEDKIEDLPEITGVDIRGVQDKEVEISIDLYRMQASKISFTDIENAIAFENMTVSSGDILQNGIRRNVRVIGEFTSVKEIENVIVKQEKGNIVYLRDIANVNFKEQEKESFAREFSHSVVMLDVKKRGGENLLNASSKIDAIITNAKENIFPKSLIISKTNDQSNDTRSMVSDLENSIILGVILVVLILFFFLGFRNALFVGIAIPLSMLLSFTILSFMGVTLNTMVLFSLVIALGMLVDNGIVVVENVYRLMDEGVPRLKAAKMGVGEVAMPIIASTATTLAAFSPLMLWEGIMGEFMKYLPITLIIVLSSSLFVALVVNPMLISLFMKVTPKKEDKKSLLNRLENVYERFLNFVLKGAKPYIFLVGTFGLLVLAFVLMSIFPPKVLFFPDTQAKQVFIYLEYPIGTDIIQTNEISKNVEQKIENHLKKYEDENGKNFLVTSVIGQVGEGTADPSRGQQGGKTPNKARITIDFVKFQDRRGIETEQVLKDIRNLLKGYPGLSVVVDKPEDGPPTGAPINIEVSGDDYDLLLNTANNLKQFINQSSIAGIEELKLDIEQGKPEMSIIVDRQKARRLGVSTGQIGGSLRTSLYGKEISTFKGLDDDYPINIRLMDKYRYNQEALLNQKITFRDQSSGQIVQIPVSSVARATKSTTFSAVKRIDLDRVVTVFSNVLNDYNATQVNDQIRDAIKGFEIPKGVSINLTGEQEEQAKEMAFLSKALLIAVLLIFLIMVAQFNSASTPIIISVSVLLSLIGVLFGLLIFRMEFVILMTMIGVISLAGIVVNNAIVLIDYTNLIMNRKREGNNLENKKLTKTQLLESIVEGGKTRLRPVLLTAITTILGLLPLALGININFMTLITEFNPNFYIGGENVAFWGPMSWAIIFGLIFATFLTLIIIPVMFYLVNRVKLRVLKQQ